jgi:hypothetical protein
MPFVKGQSGNPKGKSNPGISGRKPDWLKEFCRKIVDEKKLIPRLAKIAAGEPIDQVINRETGEELCVPAPIDAQIKAINQLLDRGWGKSVQAVEVEVGDDLSAALRDARARLTNAK